MKTILIFVSLNYGKNIENLPGKSTGKSYQ
ncbi:hypothetical protein SAMN05421841_1056 [Chryseobacterium wanjuense]|jgi:hypothetical protein|uniref:Uncharacterized protein n=1 Tax=Chryseobacterium wanjuense TaxID=356305 RepID=A0A1I0P881_9FLAO|nr:hypothetical protein SAMN05421841_1056 [Chryseobacterium wanjuense]